MKTMNHHDARGPEETVHNLSPVVPAKPASGNPSTSLRETGVSDGAPAGNAGKLAQSESRLFHRVRIDQRAAQPEASEPLRMPPPLNQFPWNFAKDQFSAQGSDFIGFWEH
jgi:hypothetical protein